MIECYKFTHNMYKSPAPFELDTNRRARGHSLRLKKKRVKSAVRSNFFAERVVNHWNDLSDKVVHAPTLDTFKN